MKKVLILSCLLLFSLTGCGAGATKTMSCSYKTKRNDITTKTTYAIDYEGNEVKKVKITYNYHQDVMNDTDEDSFFDAFGHQDRPFLCECLVCRHPFHVLIRVQIHFFGTGSGSSCKKT